ncbi:hypothetical protein GGI05_005208 [Coemansia sp. RSA 2603]|nr:hypothetical protein GGI05_005208 [Coemansia sp. RSA 2603]
MYPAAAEEAMEGRDKDSGDGCALADSLARLMRWYCALAAAAVALADGGATFAEALRSSPALGRRMAGKLQYRRALADARYRMTAGSIGTQRRGQRGAARRAGHERVRRRTPMVRGRRWAGGADMRVPGAAGGDGDGVC